MSATGRYEIISTDVDKAVFPPQVYRFVRGQQPVNGNLTENYEIRKRIKNIRAKEFSEALSDLGIDEDAALKIVAIAIEKKYQKLGRMVTADLRKAVIDGNEETVFGVIEMYTDNSENENVRVIDIPLIPNKKEISEAIYATMKGTWWPAFTTVVKKQGGKLLLKVMDSIDKMNGELAVMPYSELAYEDDYEAINIGDNALVAVAENYNLDSWEIDQESVKPHLFASRAVDSFPTIVGPKLGINSYGYTYSGLAVYEIDPEQHEENDLSGLIRNAEFNARILGVERLVFIYKTRTTYADTLVRKMAKSIAGVTLSRRFLVISSG
ncbi:hypothetical protein B1757_13340 [Acidithiobacillus marinus]|uniref:Uncharacterized protein n=1 Tax=Acidithiobacillus marinus TaxID=187490 RepID=A0A2I1DIK9_9PROT|nr:hypothetical protein [Acidithiobacillus marinus]PKY09707.1 hypothetical protein B1757_13340 [Acidithiobacillus marinus]